MRRWEKLSNWRKYANLAAIKLLFPSDSSFAHGRGIVGSAMCAAPQTLLEPQDRPFDPFERLMLADDRPGRPMRFFVEFRATGPLREERLRGAIAAAARRHPLLTSRLVFRRGAPHWLASAAIPTVVWHPTPSGPSPWAPFDLRQESGLRCVVLPDGPDRHRVVMMFHHSTCDGVAALEFAGDMWAIYGGAAPRPLTDPTTVRPRRRAGVAAPTTPPAPAARSGLEEAWEFARFRPAALALVRGPAPARSEDESISPPYAWLEFDVRETDTLRAAAAACGGSLNDLVIAAVMRAAVAWNSAARDRPGDVRITVPVSLRSPGRREPARNTMAYAFLDRTAAACAAPGPLTESIAAATKWILEHDAARGFLDTLDVLARWPGMLWLATRWPGCFSTAVVSYVGDPSRRMRTGLPKHDGLDAAGDVVIERCVGVPPLRPWTRASIGATTYAGRLALCCLCSAHDDPRHGARMFLERVRATLLESTATAASAPPIG
jgi:hypothetical protein